MGHSKAEKAKSHDRIVTTAATQIRQAGLDGIGVADLMKEAGLTQGGFYRHFDSREALVIAAASRALAQGDARMNATVDGAERDPLATLIDAYLGVDHRDDMATSCAVSALANDVARSGSGVRTAYSEQVERYIELICSLVGPHGVGGVADRQWSIAALSAMAGGIAMARAVNDERLSMEILTSVAAQLKAWIP